MVFWNSPFHQSRKNPQEGFDEQTLVSWVSVFSWHKWVLYSKSFLRWALDGVSYSMNAWILVVALDWKSIEVVEHESCFLDLGYISTIQVTLIVHYISSITIHLENV
jgi:hypothetical protein